MTKTPITVATDSGVVDPNICMYIRGRTRREKDTRRAIVKALRSVEMEEALLVAL